MAAHLIVVSGLPGVGKTSVAAIVAARIGAVHLSIDAVEEAMLASGVPAGWTVGVAAYESVRAVAELNLRSGNDVVIDAAPGTVEEVADELVSRIGTP
ncbi:AAA family ATPase [Microbacterium sp. NPDC056234]|uniref:AAA family ATPase n=1 Tax=Microbacterium sp. NPDC056234 TaxID=3345757 RepID=UPI0035E0BB6A